MATDHQATHRIDLLFAQWKLPPAIAVQDDQLVGVVEGNVTELAFAALTLTMRIRAAQKPSRRLWE